MHRPTTLSLWHQVACLLMLAPVAIGCNSSSVENAAPPSADDRSVSDSTATSTPASSTNTGPVDYAALVEDLARRLRDVSSLYRQPVNASNLESLSRKLNDVTAKFDEVADRLLVAPVPDESTARQLESGALTKLSDAVKDGHQLWRELVNRRSLNNLSESHLNSAMTRARSTRKRLLMAITPEEPEAEVATNSPPAGLEATTGAGTGFAAASANDPASDSPDMKEADASTPTKVPAGLADADSVGWNGIVDPAPADLLAPEEPMFEIPIPGMTRGGVAGGDNGAQQLQARLDQSASADIVYPRTPSPFVRVGSNASAKQSSEVWNFQTNEKVGTIRKLELQDATVLALSADGAYFAAQPMHEPLIGIWDVQAAKPLGGINISDWSGLEFAGFGIDNRLVIVDDSQLKTFTMPDGKPAHTAKLDSWADLETAIMTPGGKYFASPENASFDDFINFYNIQTGTLDSRLTLEGDRGDPTAMVISPPGDRLFVLTQGIQYHLSVYDLRSGRLTSDASLDMTSEQFTSITTKFYHGPLLAAFADGERVLFKGEYIFDSETGSILQQLPESVIYHVGIVGPNHLAVLNGNQLSPWSPATK